MNLRRIHLENFRSCELMDLDLDPDLTVLAGENNSGKTTVLDAIRLLTAPLDDRRDLWARPEDITRGEGAKSFVLSGEFENLTSIQRGLNIAALADPTGDVVRYGLSYTPPKENERRGRVTYWAGVENGGEPEPEARDLIRHVHLPALRDALRALSSGSSERIALILRHLAGAEDVQSFEAAAKEAFDTVEEHSVITNASASIQTGLTRLTEGVSAQKADLGFVPARLERLARDLRFKLAGAGFDPAELAESGLGYANLLFMATVIAELDSANDADLTILLVEEPEAHLHPQLQLTVLAFLEAEAKASRLKAVDPAKPAGHIQVLVSTHSPNITAATSIEKVVVLTRVESRPAESLLSGESSTPSAQAEQQSAEELLPVRSESRKASRAVAIPVKNLALSGEILQKLDRYLDVSRSSLLFGRRVCFVEGISEAILLRVLGRTIVLEKEATIEETADKSTRARVDEENRKARAARSRFDATAILPIGGVDFQPYIRLLLTAIDGVRLAERVVVVTDEDPHLSYNRESLLKNLATDLGAEEQLLVRVGKPTLEAELLLPMNGPLLREVFLSLHPKSVDRWEKDVASLPSASQGGAFVELLAAMDTRKGELSQEIAARISSGIDFEVPLYLAEAVRDISRA